MENLSSLFPTDNLYKFVATTGLLLIVFCFVYPELKQVQYKREINEIDGYMEELGHLVDASTKSVTEDSLQVADVTERITAVANMKANEIDLKYLAELVSELDGITTKADRISNQLDSLAILNVRGMTRMKKAEIEAFDGRRKEIFQLSIIGKIVGFFMVVWGFWNWYRFGQRPQDELLKLQLEEYKRKLSPTSDIAPQNKDS